MNLFQLAGDNTARLQQQVDDLRRVHEGDHDATGRMDRFLKQIRAAGRIGVNMRLFVAASVFRDGAYLNRYEVAAKMAAASGRAPSSLGATDGGLHMLTVIALSPADGWAVVASAGRFLLVRPPYRRQHQTPVDKAYIEAAVLRLGFEHLRQPAEFPDWAGLIAHLNQTVASTRAALGHEINDPALGERTLAVAPESVLDGILDQARSTLLPDPNAWLGLERMLSAMLRVSTVTGTPSLLNKALDLQDDIREARRKRDEGLHQLAVGPLDETYHA
jgi:hypothetical protein